MELIYLKIPVNYENQSTSKQVYQILTCFDKIYFEMTDLEKKEFFRNFIDEIELYSERQSDGHIVKLINFNFPVYYNGNSNKVGIEALRHDLRKAKMVLMGIHIGESRSSSWSTVCIR